MSLFKTRTSSGFVLLKYLMSTKPEEVLLKPGGPLASDLLSSVISTINKEVKGVLEKSSSTAKETKRGKYDHYTPEEKAEILKRAVEHGIAATIRFYSGKHPERPALKESTVRMWKNQYVSELKRKRQAGEETSIMTLHPRNLWSNRENFTREISFPCNPRKFPAIRYNRI